MPDAGLETGRLVEMAGGEGRPDTTASVSGGDLDRLMQTEQRLQAMVAESEVEIARIRAAAQEAVEVARAHHARELADALQAMESRVAAEGDADLRRIASEYQAERVAFESISDAEVGELAQVVIRRLLSEDDSAPGQGGQVT